MFFKQLNSQFSNSELLYLDFLNKARLKSFVSRTKTTKEFNTTHDKNKENKTYQQNTFQNFNHCLLKKKMVVIIMAFYHFAVFCF